MSWYGNIDLHFSHKFCIQLTPIVRIFLYDWFHVCLTPIAWKFSSARDQHRAKKIIKSNLFWSPICTLQKLCINAGVLNIVPLLYRWTSQIKDFRGENEGKAIVWNPSFEGFLMSKNSGLLYQENILQKPLSKPNYYCEPKLHCILHMQYATAYADFNPDLYIRIFVLNIQYAYYIKY